VKSIPTIAIVIAAVALVVAVVVVGYLYWQRRRKQAAAAAAAKAGTDPAAMIAGDFDAAETRFQAKVPSSAERAAIPRVLMIGERGAGKTTLLGATALNTSLHKADDPKAGDGAMLNVWTFDGALVFEPRGDVFLTPDGEVPESPAVLGALLDSLTKSRSERPIDAIVLTLPCTDLAPLGGGAEEERKREEDRKRKATSLHKQLGDVQRKLGVSVPVYVLVTKCDTLTSFESFGKEVAASNRQAILGWSRVDPRGPVAAAREADALAQDFVGEAMTSLERRLSARQILRFLAGSASPAGEPAEERLGRNDGFFLFPGELRYIADPLRTYVDEIFIPSVYDETFDLRGIYFCGDVPRRELEPELAREPKRELDPKPEPNVLFVRQLFADKIIKETNRAKPSEAARWRRSAIVLGLQITALVLGVVAGAGLTLEFDRIRADAQPLSQCMTHILQDLERQQEATPPDAEELKQQTVELFKDFAVVHTERMATSVIPLSWLSMRHGGLDGRLQGAIELGYERVVLKAFDQWLSRKEDDLVQPSPPNWRNPGLPISLETSPEFVKLDAWLLQVKLFERELKRYNGLATKSKAPGGGEPTDEQVLRISEARLADVTELAEYLLGYKAEPGFYTESRYYRQILGHGVSMSPHEVDVHRREQVIDRAKDLFDSVFGVMHDVFKEEVVRADIRALETGFNALAAGGDTYSAAQLTGLRTAIARTEIHVSEPILSWMPTKVPPDQPGLDRLFDMVDTSMLLGPDMTRDLRRNAEQGLYAYPTYVERARTDVTDALLKHRGEALSDMALSDDVVAFKKPIDDLLGQTFMRARPEDEIEEVPEAKANMRWDLDRLKEAEALVKEYDAFVQAGAFKRFRAVTPTMTQAVQDNITQLAQRSLVAMLKSRIRRAVVEEPSRPSLSLSGSALGERTKEHVENLRLATAPLREVIGAFMRFHRDTDRDRLGVLVRTHGDAVLEDAYRLLLDARLYEIGRGPFRAWQAGESPAFEAFGVTDAAGLAEVVAGYRTQAASISKEYAEPVIDLLDAAEVAQDKKQQALGLAKWRGVVGPLRDWDAKKPDNSVSSLERFLTVDLLKLKLENCLSMTDQANRLRDKDFFVAQKRKILKQLRQQCVKVPSDPQMRRKYLTDLFSKFNNHIAGRFPFSKPDPLARIDDAPPEVVKEFLDDAAEFSKTYREVLYNLGATDEDARRVVLFLDSIDRVRAFLMPMWSKAASAADGACDVQVEFRANPAHEVGGNQIAAWNFHFPEEQLSYGGPKAVAHWRMGDAVRLALRWAKNSPDIPAPEQDDGGLVRDRWVTFEARGMWALLRLMSLHQTTVRDPAGSVDGVANYLRFTIQTKVDASGGFVDPMGTGPNEARVFLRVILLADKKPLPKYPLFPTSAPPL
jgi:type VI secretion system protein ImpL